MLNGPLVSFLIPTYNRTNLLQQCIASILSQTYSNIEIIVVDDASTDDTERIINSVFAGKVKYHKNEKNRGVAYSRNLGLNYAQGKYIGLLDSDDLLLDKDHVGNAVKILEENHQIGMVVSDVYCLDLDGGRVYGKTFFQTVADHRDADLSSGIKDFEYIFCHGIHSCGAVFRRDITKEIGFLNTNYKIAWDEDFFLRLAAWDKFKIYYQDIPSVGYRVHNSNLSNSLSDLYKEKIKTRINILRLNRNLKKQLGVKFERRLANQYYCLTDAYVKEKKILSSIASILNAIVIYPPIAIMLIKKIFTCRAQKLKRT